MTGMRLWEDERNQPGVERFGWFEWHRGVSNRDRRCSRGHGCGEIEPREKGESNVGTEDMEVLRVSNISQDDVGLGEVG
jgi:hypothetical protein